ncbi:MAG: hypothetical protein HRU70_05690 [Phycisphaeraceae bacterium]|nr:MAG: hypothetical protein HRU70_05690 [Phycisphaeraceae bacterium]
MKKMLVAMVAVSGLACASANAQLDRVLAVIESSTDVVMLLDADTGAPINLNWINIQADYPGTTNASKTPKGIIQVGNEIWISDQLRDGVYRYTVDENAPQVIGFIGGTGGGMDNVRGLCHLNGKVYVANSGTQNGAPGAAIVVIDVATATIEGSFPALDPFDVTPAPNGNLYVTDIAGDNVNEYTTSGTFVRTVHDSDGVTGVDFPQQIHRRANGNLLVAGFSAPIGVFEYDEVSGSQLNFWAVGNGNRGVWELGNGLYIYTSSQGVFTLDPATGATQSLIAGGFQYFGIVTFGPPPCGADFNGDGFVDFFDLDAFVECFEGGACPDGKTADFNDDGFIDFFDLDAFVEAFEAGC